MRLKKVISCLVSLLSFNFLYSCTNTSSSISLVEDETFYVSFETNGGTEITRIQVKKGEKLILPTPPSKEGFIFVNWYYDQELTQLFDENKEIDSSLTLYAKYQEFKVSEINNIDDFFNIKPNENYILKTNLDFKNEVIQPIGKRNIPFSGSFNGNGFTISNFKIENNEFNSLFGYVTGNIENLNVKNNINIEVNTTNYLSPIVSYLSSGVVENCSSSGIIFVSSSSLIEASYVGGIVARNEYGLIKKCYSTISISNNSKSTTFTGGIVGYNGSNKDKQGTIEQCYIKDNTISSSRSEDTASSYVGGIVGYNFGLVNKCFSLEANINSKVTDYQGFSGGIVGDNNGGIVSNCFSSSNINISSDTGNTFFGSIMGRNFRSTLLINSGTSENNYGFEGQKITFSSNEILKSRHTKQNVKLASLSQITSAEWFKNELFYSDFLIKDGYYPSLNTSFKKINLTLEKGTPGNPYLINNIEDLKNINPNYSYKLTNNISLKNETFSPIGTYANPFYGTFDGNNYTISNISLSGNGYNSLFGYINGIIKNLKTSYSIETNSNSKLLQYYSGLVSYSCKSYIENCSSKINISSSSNGTIIGGLVGFNEESTILKSFSEGEITFSSSNPSSYGGGLVGINQNGQINECYANVNLTSLSTKQTTIGGLVAKNDGIIKNVYSLGNIKVENSTEKIIIGGLIGHHLNNELSFSYTNNKFTIDSNSNESLIGGIIGFNESKVNNVYYYNDTVNYSFGYSIIDVQIKRCTEDEIKDLHNELNDKFYYDSSKNRTCLTFERGE